MRNPLARALGEAADPVQLATRVGCVPDRWQARALRSTDARLLLLTGRQVGKSTTAAIKAVHVAVYEPGSLVLMFAPTQRQAQELFRSAMSAYRGLGRPVPSEAENTQTLALENGSRIIALPGDEKTTRGYAGVRLVIIDEAARVDDELLHSITPMVAVSGGQIVAMSTPYGRRGWFYAAATSGRAWTVIKVKSSECPRIPKAFLDEARAEMGSTLFGQEYECQFNDAAGSYFAADDLEAIWADLPAFDLLQPPRPQLAVVRDGRAS
jgi:Terminase large subunit, T4likevirus-type, N-terminal